MKRIAIILLMFVVAYGTTMAQASKVATASSYLSDYKTAGQKPEYLLKAKEAIEMATKHEVTGIQGKTYFLKGQILHALGNDSNVVKTETDEFFAPALTAYEKALTITDKKFREQSEVVKYVRALSADVYNNAVNVYQTGAYTKAYDWFYLMKDINALLATKDLTGAVETVKCLKNAAMAADAAKNEEASMKVYEELIELDPAPNYYRIIAKRQKAAGDVEASNATLAAGAEAFPDDPDILIDQLNYFIGEGKLPEAMDIIDKAIALQPDNDMLVFVKGDALEKAKKYTEAIAAYEQALEINPKNVKALYNLGAMNYNKANEVVKEMNELSYKEEAKFNELDAKRKGLYAKAKPYFEQVLEINPDDAAAKRALTKINSAMAQ